MADTPARPDRTRNTLALAVDVTMLALILANLALIVFDWMFLNSSFQAALQAYVPAFYQFYNDTIHANFFYIDLAFVAVFIFEIGVRWALAIARDTYHRWWFYPFIHWYDVLGCVPISSLRTLRLLRVFSLLPKLQRTGLIDLKQTYLYSRYEKYRDILVEEVTDRVTIQILDGVQSGIREDNPVTKEIIDEVIAPREQAFADALAHRLQEAIARSYAPQREHLRDYVNSRVADAVEDNKEMNAIARIPGVGKQATVLLERAIADIVFHVLDDMLHDVAAPNNTAMVASVATTSTESLVRPGFDNRLSRLLQESIIDALDRVKAQVEIKQWKLEEMAERDTAA
jgi:hypothetical protein